jgi:hypothetical protein
MTTRSIGVRRGERGFALILAILSLMLLTFLGLTLATTTSTELQIATNYRWSQQALYNAEAGLEAARIILSNNADLTLKWNNILPLARVDGAGTALLWDEGSPPGPADTSWSGRDFYNMSCDTRGGIGYGRVLTDVASGTRYEDVATYEGQTLNGAFTIWIRRGLDVSNTGQFSDTGGENDSLVIIAEGRAPFSAPSGGTGADAAAMRARQAVRVLETQFALDLDEVGDPCETQVGQEGLSPSGENYNPCAPIFGYKSLESAFGTANVDGTGALTSTGAQ